MTFEKWAKDYLEKRGMFDTQAHEVVETVKVAKENEAMLKRWKDDIAGYPDAMLNVMVLTLRRHALEWIDENLPKAWYRDMFE
ncbi:MAG: hypothetical protein GY804_11580 [Alphaproteobacteria bacterium]|nr:hypothetical protein [Alphaproteobacteria bacterium]